MKRFEAGQRIWLFEENNRVYEKGLRGSPIFEKHFTEYKVVEVDKRSYKITQPSLRFSFKPLTVGYIKAHRTYLSDDQKKARIYVHENGYKISRLIQTCEDYTTLKTIADLLGYDEEKTSSKKTKPKPVIKDVQCKWCDKSIQYSKEERMYFSKREDGSLNWYCPKDENPERCQHKPN